MSYMKTLDEISDVELSDELERRMIARHEGKCSYCGQGLAVSKEAAKNGCRFHEYREYNGKSHVVRGGLVG